MKKTILIITASLYRSFTAARRTRIRSRRRSHTLDERARDGLYDLMKYIYLWNDKMPTVKLSDYPGPDDLLDALRYTPKDSVELCHRL
ncbi:MAG: hypothetical protein MZV63_24790 [Marinilabiliales bacterium]|nr:hypothetical protein [Marinilabiliales bacterium]